MFQKLSEMENELMETVKVFKGQATSSKLGNGNSLQSPTSNSRRRSLDFTPTEEDMELDSLCSHNFRAPRKKLLAQWKLIPVKQKSKCSKSKVMEEFAEFAARDLSKAGLSDDFLRSEGSLGRFKPAQVMFLIF